VRRAPGPRGAATAELALAMPLLLAVTVGLVWLLSVGAAQVRIVDAARETARAAARGDAEGVAVARGLAVAPDGSRITLGSDGDRVTVTATGEVTGPAGLFRFVPGVHLHATAVAAVEEVP